MATIEIDGKTIEVENGKMIIEVADEHDIHIPRFCYHKKLSVAANCRMCLVEVENSRKTVPACATPINHGMKIFTKSAAALRSQQAVMEFLLINHPLDCPICDQGGECELQDVSMGFGQDASEYSEEKRAVANDNLGSLIATEMTRCIQCTRCVRFGNEVAGLPELGGIGRGEKMQISTYVNHSMTSEISGNIIDLCPVGALTSKPFRFTARAWELTQHSSISPHDCLGSHVGLHVRRNELMRVVPEEKDEINETWLSDRDRFSYLGLKSERRAAQPMIKRDGQWEVVNWQTALTFAAKGIAKTIKQHGPEQFAAFSSPSSTLEEHYLLQKMMRALGVQNLDHRLHQTDFRDEESRSAISTNTLKYVELESQQVIFVVGSHLSSEVPLAGVRLRKAQSNGAKIYALNPVNYDFHVQMEDVIVASPSELPMQLATILAAAVDKPASLPEAAQTLILGLTADKRMKSIAKALKNEKAVIVSGEICDNHPHASLLRSLIALLSECTGAKTVHFSTGSNSAGAVLAGMLPHRGSCGKKIDPRGLHVQDALNQKLKGYLLMGVEPGFDFANPSGARQALLSAEFVVALSAFGHDTVLDYSDVVLPIAPYAETSGTYLNIDGVWQQFKGAISPHGEARPAWKVLRVLANILHCDGFDYTSSEDVLNEVKTAYSMMNQTRSSLYFPEALPVPDATLTRIGEWPMYRGDALVRHADALQHCGAAEKACVRIHPQTAEKLNLGDVATVSQTEFEITLPLLRDARVALDTVWVPNAMPETADLGHAYATIKIK